MVVAFVLAHAEPRGLEATVVYNNKHRLDQSNGQSVGQNHLPFNTIYPRS